MWSIYSDVPKVYDCEKDMLESLARKGMKPGIVVYRYSVISMFKYSEYFTIPTFSHSDAPIISFFRYYLASAFRYTGIPMF